MQDGAMDCGICSLLCIVKYYGGYVSKEYLRLITNTTRSGVDAFSLLEAGRKIGFDSRGVTGSVLMIDKKFLPCIAHVIVEKKYKHFVVIYKIDKKRNTIYIMDPASGFIKMNIDEFLIISTSNYLFFTPNKQIPIVRSNNMVKNIIFEFIHNNKYAFIWIIIFSLFFTFLNIITSFNLQFVLEKAITYSSKINLYFIFVIMFILSLLKAIVEYFREKILLFVDCNLDYKILINSFSHVLSLPYLYYKDRTTGEVLSRISDLRELKNYIGHIFSTIFVDLVLVLFSFFFLVSINFSLSIILIIFSVIYCVIIILFNRCLIGSLYKLRREDSAINSYMIELINGVETIKGMNIFNTVFDKFCVKYDKYANASYRLGSILQYKKLICDILSYSMFLIVILVGSFLVIEEKISLGSFLTFNSMICYFWEPIKNLMNFDFILKNVKVTIERINELLSYEKECLFDDQKSIRSITGNIVVNDFKYTYNSINLLFNNLNLNINKGDKVVLCGNSGCGKSTLAKILAGFISVNRGMIFIDGKDINEFNLWALRENITYVSQNDFVFNDTVFNNININNSRDEDKLVSVCEMVTVDQMLLEKNSSYSTLIDENGSNFSGGEKQMIVLARTFLKESNVYILDETLSQIDSSKERVILKNLFENFSEKTIIVISHRFDNNDLYDKVINLEKANGN